MGGSPGEWPPGNGEMARRIRSHDWVETPLGPIAGWPRSLRSALAICLGSWFPSMVLWGPELICFLNDAQVSVLGTAYLGSLGRPAPEELSESWSVFEPSVTSVLATGDGTGMPDLVATLDRGGGPRSAHFAVSFGPIHDEFGRTAGVLISALET